jgi:hypothetical protein
VGFGAEVSKLGEEVDVDKRRGRNTQLLDFPPTNPNGSPDAMFEELQRPYVRRRSTPFLHR